MKMIDYNKDILSVITPLLQDYMIFLDIDGVTFLKNNKERSFLGFSWFISENHRNEFVIRNTKYWINYPEMERIVKPILFKNDLIGKESVEGTSSSFILNSDSSLLIPYDVNDGCVLNERYIGDIIQRLVMILNLEAFPFFAKWNSLNTLYEFIKDKTEAEELESILGIFWQFKKAAILRLCNDKNYQEYIEALVKRFELIFERRPESIDVQRYYNAAKELKEVLDKTEPVYNV